MKARAQLLTVMVTVVLAGLLFSQAGAGYFHSEHDAHRNTQILGAGQFALQEHGEHCNLCSIDLIQLFRESCALPSTVEVEETALITLAPGTPVTFTDFTRDRSPPALS
jgi:hypothetical protein